MNSGKAANLCCMSKYDYTSYVCTICGETRTVQIQSLKAREDPVCRKCRSRENIRGYNEMKSQNKKPKTEKSLTVYQKRNLALGLEKDADYKAMKWVFRSLDEALTTCSIPLFRPDHVFYVCEKCGNEVKTSPVLFRGRRARNNLICLTCKNIEMNRSSDHIENVARTRKKNGIENPEVIERFRTARNDTMMKRYGRLSFITQESLRNCRKTCAETKSRRSANEKFFEELLIEHGIKFESQFDMFERLWDFLVDDWILVEVDGAVHMQPWYKNAIDNRETIAKTHGFEFILVDATKCHCGSKVPEKVEAAKEQIKNVLFPLFLTKVSDLNERKRKEIS